MVVFFERPSPMPFNSPLYRFSLFWGEGFGVSFVGCLFIFAWGGRVILFEFFFCFSSRACSGCCFPLVGYRLRPASLFELHTVRRHQTTNEQGSFIKGPVFELLPPPLQKILIIQFNHAKKKGIFSYFLPL